MRFSWRSILVALGLAAGGGGGYLATRPSVEAPAAPTTALMAVSVHDGARNPIPGLRCSVQMDEEPDQPCVLGGEGGIQAFVTIPASKVGWGGTLTLSAEGFEPFGQKRVRAHVSGALHDTADQPFEVTLTPVRTSLLPLRPRGHYLERADGSRFTWIGASQFNLLNRYRNGENIDGLLAQLEGLGFNAVRVFTVYDICATGAGCQAIGRSEPTQPLYDAIPGFSRRLAKYGLYAELVGFTGPYGLLPTDDAKVQHWERLMDASSGLSNILLELVNEYDHPANAGIPLARLRRPAGNLASHGSATQDQTPLLPLWDYATYRPGSGGEWMRKVAHNGMEDVADKFNIPTIANETTRFPDNDNRTEHAYDAARGAALLSAGAVFHSVSGKAAVPWAGAEYDLAKWWALGANSVPLGCQGQPYRRVDDPRYLRVYYRGGSAECRVEIRR